MKKLSRFTFCFICIPLFFVSCASKPENSQDTKAELEAPLLDTESDAEAGDNAEGEYEGDEADLGDTIDGDTSEEDSDQEADEDTELEAEIIHAFPDYCKYYNAGSSWLLFEILL